MRRLVWFILAACLFIFTAACQGPSGDLRGATPVGYIRPAVVPVENESAEPVAIADLLDTPEMYDGQLIEVSGTYYNRQVVVCSTRPLRSPATWALSDGEVRIPAGGLDERLEELPSGRIELTVIGRWLHWQGPVGCGRQALITEVYYLDLVEVVSPNPITIAAVGSSEGITSTAGTSPGDATVSPNGYPGPGETESGEPQISATTVLSGTDFPGLPQPVGTPVLFTPNPTGGVNLTATPTKAGVATATATTSTTGSSPTPTQTSSAATASPTTSTGGPGPTATSIGNGQVTIDKETLPVNSIETGELAQNEINRWPLVITSTTVITINVDSDIELDAGIMLRSPSGNIIAEQNKSQDGDPEVMAAIPLTELGTYDILITSENNVPGYYAILVLNEESYTFVFNGTLEIGDSRTKELPENNDHFWHFSGTAGETVTIRVTPSDDGDYFITLYGSDGTRIVDFHNDTGDGEVEEILSFTLPDTGFYSIHLGEFNYLASSYSIDLISG